MLRAFLDSLGRQSTSQGQIGTSSTSRDMSKTLPPGISIASFSEGYRKYFEVVPATNEQLKWHNYHIRHEVYARELGREPIRPDEVEIDVHDRHAVHCLIRAVATHMFVGCARLIRPDPANTAASLPFETTCSGVLDRSIVDPAHLDPARIAEISRLAVIGQFRRRPGEGDTPFAINDDFGIVPRIRLPYLTLGLYLALIALARWHRIDTLFVIAAPALLRALAHLGIGLRPIGTSIDLNGEHVPAMLDTEQVEFGLAPYLRPFYDTIAEEIKRGMPATCSSVGHPHAVLPQQSE
jgi:N-acyl amino acid synthase of PEP-CTERM/exosortase system